MSDLIKCSRCKFRGAQTDFPLKSSGQGYLKTCTPCAQKSANATYTKRHATNDSGPPKKQRQHIQDRVAGDTPNLNWDEFCSLLCENKDSAFQLHALVALDREDASKENTAADGLGVAWVIANAVQDETGYKFK